MDTTWPLILASASPRRRALLAAAGLTCTVAAADVDESVHDDESPVDYVRRLAQAKATAVAGRYPDSVVLGADTTVVVDDQILGKPLDEADAVRMLRTLSGRRHEVMTAVALAGVAGEALEVATTAVWLRPLAAHEIDWYVATGEPRDKAGAYAIQGLASRFIPRIDGEYSNVVGLPLTVVDRLLRQLRVVS